jgi:hypothetical protein
MRPLCVAVARTSAAHGEKQGKPVRGLWVLLRCGVSRCQEDRHLWLPGSGY